MKFGNVKLAKRMVYSFIMRKCGRGLGAQPLKARALKKVETSYTVMRFGHKNCEKQRESL